jgi:hypothetical protein
MALEVILDNTLQIVREPGYYQHVTNDAFAENGDPTGGPLWRDQAFGTLMYYPKQLDPSFKDTAAQLSSIIGAVDRGSGVLQISNGDISDKTIFEASYKQNENNPWVFFSPVTAFGAPTISQTPQGLTGQGSLTSINTTSEGLIFNGPISSSDPKCLAFSKDKLPGNQALYLRYYVPPSGAGHQTIYWFMIGQFCVMCQHGLVQVYEDLSSGSRSSWRRVGGWPLFTAGAIRNTESFGRIGNAAPAENVAEDRSLLWLPFRRHWVYLQSSLGLWAKFPTYNFPKFNGKTGTDLDYDITSEKEIAIWALSQSTGQFQIQKILYDTDAIEVKAPHFMLDYTPTDPLTALNLVEEKDAYHGTSITHGIPTTPPGYNQPENSLDTCPPPVTTTDPDDDPSRTYGVTITFQSAGSGRFTPFLYGYDIRVERRVGTWPNSPTNVLDTLPGGGGARIREAVFTSSLEPGEGELTVDVLDTPTYSAESQYYRAEVPIALFDTGTAKTLFTGITDPTEVVPKRLSLGPRFITFKGHDLWKVLEDSTLRYQRDWGPKNGEEGAGHIFVVDFIAKQAGIDTTGADYPKATTDTAAIGSPHYDWKLGGVKSTIAQASEELNPPWKPRNNPPDTAASFIKRIAKLFSGWDVGFYPDGQFYYRPKDFYNGTRASPGEAVNADTVTTFHSLVSGASPRYYREVEFRNVEPELNVLQIGADRANDSKLQLSSRFVDRASINNVAAPNFMGRWKAGYAKLFGAFTCDELNRVCMILWDEARKRKLMVKFRGEYVPALKIGHVLALEGYNDPMSNPYQWRLQNFRAQYKRHSFHDCLYEALLIEPGHL